MEPFVTEYFACQVFDDKVMKQRLSDRAYISFCKVIEDGEQMTIELADQIATEIREWAMELGATHFTHWFQPMTGSTAEKHDALIGRDKQGNVILDFDGKALIKGEADASSFPSGGLRATFEARGYTAWDCTSPPFVRKDKGGSCTLCIPTAFCSFTGEALDEKTPLLRSMEVLSHQCIRLLRLLGHDDVKRVIPTVGGEQEYFLIDKSMYRQRKDLVYTGRTLFGAPPAKGQELEDQYYASMSERVAAFMAELNEELWKLGVPAKTQHYEVAPAQYELAPIFCDANVATDHNQLIMEMMRKVADRHNFACLLHEKPFAHVNGSGKHNNWGLSTDKGKNLLKPAKVGQDNTTFLAFFVAVIAAVDEYAGALRMSCASLSNESRLGGHEAPPAIISIFIGQNMMDMLDGIKIGNGDGIGAKEKMSTGVSVLPYLLRDEADRNRTSPFAFTGNKFEFRMVGSNQSLGMPNTVLNTAVAEMVAKIADELEKSNNPRESLSDVLYTLLNKHRRILFNGNNYSEEWKEEAVRRGLPNLESTVDAFEAIKEGKYISLFEKYHVLSAYEIASRVDIGLRSYVKHATIEAATMLKMCRQKILPSCIRYSGDLAYACNQVKEAGGNNNPHRNILEECNERIAVCQSEMTALSICFDDACQLKEDISVQARAFYDKVIPQMQKVRACVDQLEIIVDKEYWKLPSYGEMLFHIV